jgi:hypothetical protein
LKRRVIFSTKGNLTLDHATLGLFPTLRKFWRMDQEGTSTVARAQSRCVEADIRYFHTGDKFHRCYSALPQPASKRQVSDDILSVFGGRYSCASA